MQKHILVIDDELDVRLGVARLLRKHGYAVTAFDSADKAGEFLRKGSCDLILLDLMMPGTPGLLFLRHLRNRMHLRMPVVLLTARSSMHDISGAYNQGAEFYITKPFEPATLMLAVDYLVADLPPEKLAQIEASLLTSENVYYGSTKTICR